MTDKEFDLDRFFDAEMNEHATVAAATREAVREPFRQLLGHCARAISNGHKLMFFGNGGSAADAQHLATELTVRYKTDRIPIAAIALTTDTSALTAIGNDFGFEELFARQIEALAHPGDVVIAISTSGRSENVIRGVKTALAEGCVAAAFTGGDGGRLNGLAEPLLVVPSKTTARIQEMHITLGQMLCNALEMRLGLVP